MIELTTLSQWNNRSVATSLANTLHKMSVISDEMFDQLITEIYDKYGDGTYVGDCNFSNDDI